MKKSRTIGERRSHAITKALLIMKLTMVLLLAGMLQVSANVSGQNITLRLDQVEIARVLISIEKQGAYRFLYNSKLPDIRQKVSINATNSSIRDVMANILTGTGLTFKLLENNLVVVLANTPELQDIRITGKVTGENGEALSGVSVALKGTSRGTTTNNNGEYALTVPENGTIVITYIGYNPQEVAVNSQSVIDIKLVAANKEMEQVIVVGYGTQRKIDVTGSVAQVRGEDIAKQASINPIGALQGKVAGVQITNLGAPGSSPEIKIRGVGTVFGSQKPLFVVDGVWFDDIAFLNPADIENINILKDASSESIYGIRASNGVVLITTKKGKAGKTVFNYNGSVGFQKVTNQIEMANGDEYVTLINELNNNQTLDPAVYKGAGTDWYKQLLRSAMVTNHQISATGGTDKSNFNISFGYLNQDGLVKKDNYERYTLRLQQEIKLATPFKLGYTLTGAYSTHEDIDGGAIFRELFSAYPVLPVRNPDGTYGDPGDFPLGDGAKYNPQFSNDYFDQDTRLYQFTGNVYGELRFAKHFTFRSSVGGEYSDKLIRNYKPPFRNKASTGLLVRTVSLLTLTEEHTRNWILENTLTYDQKFGDHSIKVLAGQGAQSYRFTKRIGEASNIANGRNFEYLSLGENVRITDVENVAYPAWPLYSTISSYFGRLNYSFQNKYLLTASIRADGSSKFASPNKWGYFPAVGIGWVVSEEKFMQNQQFFDNLKVRASWGKVGNASVPANLSISTVNQTPELIAIIGGVPVTGASIDKLVPPTTFWELGVGTDVGIEASMLNNRLTVEAGYYNRKTKDAIFDIPVLGSLGASGSFLRANQADYENKGFEFLVSWKDEVGKDWNYFISANLSINDNEVTRVNTGANPIYGGGVGLANGSLATRTILGEPIGHFYGYNVIGVFQTDAEAEASAPGAGLKAGDFKFEDISGPSGKPDGQITTHDRVNLGSPFAKYSYGINTTVNYKQFDLTLDFQGVSGVKVYNANLGWRYGSENFTKDFYDKRWHGEGTSNSYPSARIGSTYNSRPSSYFVEDGSYFRIRNIQLGYTLPSALINRWGLSRFRVFANAQNPFTSFSYRGFSPEIGGTSPIGAGIDANLYPLFATYNFGVNLSF